MDSCTAIYVVKNLNTLTMDVTANIKFELGYGSGSGTGTVYLTCEYSPDNSAVACIRRKYQQDHIESRFAFLHKFFLHRAERKVIRRALRDIEDQVIRTNQQMNYDLRQSLYGR